MPSDRLRFLLLQIRDADDPIVGQEVGCFASQLDVEPAKLQTHSLLDAAPSRGLLDAHDMVLLGGSGDYSAAAPTNGGKHEWLARTFDVLRELHSLAKPTFASCWGFQAICRALGGDCIHDPGNAELGSVMMRLTRAGRGDPVFGDLPPEFLGHAGHQDRVNQLPADAALLASSERVAEQAIRFEGKPIYATQFHPELTRATLIERVRAYPEYVERIAGVPLAEFETTVRETPESNSLLRRMVEVVFG